MHTYKIVILAGWLGSKPKDLEKYKRCYESLRWNVMIYIASPMAVGDAILPQEKGKEYKDDEFESIPGLAQRIINDLYLQQIKCNSSSRTIQFIWHSFSNGGVFLLNQFYPLFVSSPRHLPANIDNKHNTVSSDPPQLIGLVFDSSPCYYQNVSGLHRASQNNAFGASNAEVVQILELLQTNDPNGSQIQQRAHQFWRHMKTQSYNDIPEMYIYGTKDNLTPCSKLKELIQFRRHRKQHGNQYHHHQTLELLSSKHCQYLQYFPHEYQNAVTIFLESCSHLSRNGIPCEDENMVRTTMFTTRKIVISTKRTGLDRKRNIKSKL